MQPIDMLSQTSLNFAVWILPLQINPPYIKWIKYELIMDLTWSFMGKPIARGIEREKAWGLLISGVPT